ncbi:MAG TPA: SRPBCC domain-containing protein [Caulobacteraceae bacterium]
MSDAGEHLRVPAVRFQRVLPGPIARVWAHLTQCEKLAGWYGEAGEIEPCEGGLINFMDGHVRGVVTQWRPPRRLAYTWNVFAPGEAHSAYPESYLNIDLAAVGAAVRLTLLHLPVLERFEAQNAVGWHTFLDILKATLMGETVHPRGVYMERNAKLYGLDLAKLQR